MTEKEPERTITEEGMEWLSKRLRVQLGKFPPLAAALTVSLAIDDGEITQEELDILKSGKIPEEED